MPRVTEMWAFVVADEDEEDEGIPAFLDPTTNVWMPMVGADRQRIDSLLPVAQRMCDLHGKPYMVRRFVFDEEVEVIYPREEG